MEILPEGLRVGCGCAGAHMGGRAGAGARVGAHAVACAVALSHEYIPVRGFTKFGIKVL